MKCNVAVLAVLLSPIGLLAQQGVVKPVLTPKSSVSNTSDTTPSQLTTVEPVDPGTYIIGPQDHIQVTVWKEPAITGPILVRPDGMITVPLIGDLLAAGMTPSSLGQKITTRLEKYIQDPDVTVSILNVHPKQIFMLGEVQHVGPIVMTPGMTILQAISAAGGLTPFANSKHLYVLRSVNGKEQKLPFNYKSAIKNGNQQGIVLLPNDTIVVP
jgi:polysaccharide export outer membrane protein